MASTSSAVQSYCAIRVRDPDVLARLVVLTGNQRKVAECGAFLAICGDTRRHRMLAARHGKPYDTRLEAFLVATIDASLFAQNLCVALESMGYGICYIGGLRNHLHEVDALLRVPHGVYPLFGLCVGIPAEDPQPRPRLPVECVLFDERYPDDPTLLRHVDAYDAEYERWLVARGAEAKGWSRAMGERWAVPERVDLADYYASKGAVLD